MNYSFSGFTDDTLRFFKELEKNNNKEWFDQNRKWYETEVRDRFKELCESLIPTMKSIDIDFELRPHRCISRINRDTRFSLDKSPYKTHLWMTFMLPAKSEEWVSLPGFFLELGAEQYIYGMGFFQPKRFVMDDFRDHMAYRAEEFKEVTQRTVIDRGFSIGGEEYKRPLKNDLDEYFQQWYHRKGVYVSKTKKNGEEVFSSEFQQMIQDDFLALEWLYNFMKQSIPE